MIPRLQNCLSGLANLLILSRLMDLLAKVASLLSWAGGLMNFVGHQRDSGILQAAIVQST